MQAIATVCTYSTHKSAAVGITQRWSPSAPVPRLDEDPHVKKIWLIATKRKLPFLCIAGKEVFVRPDEPTEPYRAHFDASMDGAALVSSLRERIKCLGIKELMYYPPPGRRLDRKSVV